MTNDSWARCHGKHAALTTSSYFSGKQDNLSLLPFSCLCPSLLNTRRAPFLYPDWLPTNLLWIPSLFSFGPRRRIPVGWTWLLLCRSSACAEASLRMHVCLSHSKAQGFFCSHIPQESSNKLPDSNTNPIIQINSEPSTGNACGINS